MRYKEDEREQNVYMYACDNILCTFYALKTCCYLATQKIYSARSYIEKTNVCYKQHDASM